MAGRRSPGPELGTLLQVVPVVQAKIQKPWTVCWVSVERWDQCFVVNFDLQQDGPIEPATKRLYPMLDVQASDDRGGRYASWFGGGYGGGRRDGSRHYRLIYKFAPPLDPAARQLSLIVQLELVQQGEDFPPRDIVVQTESDPWTFTAELPPWRIH